MSIDSIVKKGKVCRPPRIIIYGDKGIGKTTVAAQIKNAIFIPTEDGTDAVDVARTPKAQSFEEVLDYISMLLREEHSYRALIIDTADELDALAIKSILQEKQIETLKDLGYGSGFMLLADKWRMLLKGLDVLRDKKSMAIVFICHSQVRTFNSPDAEPYDRYEIKLSKQASDLVRYWADIIGFATMRTIVETDDGGFNKKHARALKHAERVLHVGKSPCYEAGNRYNLPDTLPLSWESLSSEILKKMKG